MKNTIKTITIFVVIFALIAVVYGVFAAVINWSNGVVDQNATNKAVAEIRQQLEQQYQIELKNLQNEMQKKEKELEDEYAQKLQEALDTSTTTIETATLNDYSINFVYSLGVDGAHKALYFNTGYTDLVLAYSTSDLNEPYFIDVTGIASTNMINAWQEHFSINLEALNYSNMQTIRIKENEYSDYILVLKDAKMFDYYFNEFINATQNNQTWIDSDTKMQYNVDLYSGIKNLDLTEIFDCYEYNKITCTLKQIKECLVDVNCLIKIAQGE